MPTYDAPNEDLQHEDNMNDHPLAQVLNEMNTTEEQRIAEWLLSGGTAPRPATPLHDDHDARMDALAASTERMKADIARYRTESK